MPRSDPPDCCGNGCPAVRVKGSPMKVLVTGGAGFIGSHLSEALLERGDDVWALDDLSTGCLENIRGFHRNPRFHFLEGTVLAASTVNGLVAECDRVFHLAAAVGVKYSLEN